MAKESSGLYHWTIITRILKFTLSCTTPPHPHFPRPQRKKIKYSVEVNRLSRLGFCLCLQPSFSPHSMDPQLHLQELLCFPNTTYSGPCLCASLSMELEHPDLPVPSLIRLLSISPLFSNSFHFSLSLHFFLSSLLYFVFTPLLFSFIFFHLLGNQTRRQWD